MGSALHALRLPDDIGRTRTHVMYVKLAPRAEHGGTPARYFRVVDAYPVEVAQTMGWPEPWPASLVALKQMQDESERLHRGRIAAAMVECPPLAVQTVPFGSIPTLTDLTIVPNWKEVLIRDVASGVKFAKRYGC
ncbi:hypothetical protein AcW1_008535 [Taiwanofungus camphoratus]|nr:hypothetical protein AcV5_008820 [Antrodia cinnamomea]KAI0951501.1 hypothetical protein AcW1_008535 [Antrodia cinnamomea]KAI0956398.1 hypothetical protein AcV7_006817 [Antrodia cinnamomea]